MSVTSEPVVATTINVTMEVADTEYSAKLPLGTKYFSLQNRTAIATRWALESGHVATPTAPYNTLKSGAAYNSPEKFGGRPTIYLAVADATGPPIVEILCWAAPPRAQRDTILVADTWATSDTVTLTIGSQAAVVTIGADTDTDEVANTIKEAFNGEALSDGTASVDPAAGAKSLSNFANLTAEVSGSTVTITGEKGIAFTLVVTEVTAGDGTATEATATEVSVGTE